MLTKRARVDSGESEQPAMKFDINNTQSIITELSNLKGLLMSNSDIYPPYLTEKLTENIPEFVLIGDQSAGKSSVVTRLVRAYNPNTLFELYTSGGCATKFPIQIEFERGSSEAIEYYSVENGITNSTTLERINEVTEQLKDICENITIRVKIIGLTTTPFIITDMPGFQVEGGDNLVNKERIKALYTNYFTRPNVTFIHVINTSIDIACINSYMFLRNNNVSMDRQIIVATHPDLTSRKQDGIQSLLNEYSKRFVGVEVFFVQARGVDGYLTSEQEMQSLRSLNIINPALDIKFGINSLRDRIQTSLYKFVTDQFQTVILGLLKELHNGTCNMLQDIGEHPVSPDIAAIHWTKCMEQISHEFLNTDRRLINDMVDKLKTVGSKFDSSNNERKKIVRKAIEESKKSRGRQKEDLVSIDAPVRTLMNTLGNELTSEIDGILASNNTIIVAMINEMLSNIDKKNPMCGVLTNILRDSWMSIFDDCWNEYYEQTMAKVTTLCDNQEGFKGFSLHYLMSLEVLEKYMKDGNTGGNNPLESYKQYLKRHIKEGSNDITEDNSVMHYVEQMWNKVIETIQIGLPTDLSNLATRLDVLFTNPEVQVRSTKHRDDISETSDILRRRHVLIEVQKLTNSLIRKVQ